MIIQYEVLEFIPVKFDMFDSKPDCMVDNSDLPINCCGCLIYESGIPNTADILLLRGHTYIRYMS